MQSPFYHLPYVPLARYLMSLRENRPKNVKKHEAERDWLEARGVLLERIEKARSGDIEAWRLLIGMPVIFRDLSCIVEGIVNTDLQVGFIADPPFEVRLFCIDASTTMIATNISLIVPNRKWMPKLDTFK